MHFLIDILSFVRDINDYVKREFRNFAEEGSQTKDEIVKNDPLFLTNINILIRKFVKMTEYN